MSVKRLLHKSPSILLLLTCIIVCSAVNVMSSSTTIAAATSTAAATGSSATWPQYYDTKTHSFISQSQVIQRLMENQVIFVGEFHDHIWGHKIEHELLVALYANLTRKSTKPISLAISLEMFERDVQSWVNGYLESQITEEFFLENSRPWPNYSTDYKPLVDFVKSKKQQQRNNKDTNDTTVTVLAANIPRRYASFVAQGKESAIFQMPDVEMSYMAPRIDAPHDQYYKNFYDLMEPAGWDKEKIERYYRAQCIKDDTMAMSIAEFFKSAESYSQEARVISYSGSFHVNYHLGLVTKVNNWLSNIRSILLSIVSVDTSKPLNPVEYDTVADIVIFAPENPKK